MQKACSDEHETHLKCDSGWRKQLLESQTLYLCLLLQATAAKYDKRSLKISEANMLFT